MRETVNSLRYSQNKLSDLELETNSFLSAHKLWWHGDRITEWLEKGETQPITASIDISLACNHECPECLYAHDRESDIPEVFQNWENVKLAIDNLKRGGIRGLLFTGGGEPLISNLTPKALEYTYKSGIGVAIITNGENLNKKNIDTILHTTDWIRISVDGATDESFLKMHSRGSKSFNRVLSNIKKLVNRRNISKSKTVIGIGMLTCSHTIHEMLKFTQLAFEMQVDYCQFRPLINENKQNIEIHKKIFNQNLSECIRWAEGKPIRVMAQRKKYMLMMGNKIKTFSNCSAVHFSLTIGADANVYLCCHHRYDKDFITANIFDVSWLVKRRQELNKIMFSLDINRQCPLLCKYNGMNELLEKARLSGEHKNFL